MSTAAEALSLTPARPMNVTTIARGTSQMALDLAVPEGPNLSDADRKMALERFEIIEPILNFEKFRGIWAQCRNSKLAVIRYLAEHHKTKQRTLYRWMKLYQDGGLPALVNRARSDKGQPKKLTPAALDFLLAAAVPRRGAYGAYSIAEIARAYNEERAWRAAHSGKRLGEFEIRKYGRYVDEDCMLRAEAQLPEVKYETLRLWYSRIPQVVKVLGRDGVEAYSNTQEIISFREISAVDPLDYVVMDHRRLDLFCLIPTRGGWSLARPWLTAAIDMRTRKWLAWAIVETPSSDSIAVVLKRSFLAWGLPKNLYWDNGKDFTCEWFEGKTVRSREASRIGELATEWRGVLESLGVRVTHAIVRRARSKIIEPNFIRTALFDRSLPWWCGHKPGARPERFDELMQQHEAWLRGEKQEPAFPTIQEIAQLYNREMQILNERELERAEGMRAVRAEGYGWMSPNEAWEKLIPCIERRTVPADVLAFAFRKRHEVTVRHGEVSVTWSGRRYHYRLIGNAQGLMLFNGRDAEIAYDPEDLETVAIYVDAAFVGLAANVELRRMGEAHFVEDEKIRRASRRETRNAIAAAHKTYVPSVIERVERLSEQLPGRVQPARLEVPAEMPAQITAAVEAVGEDKRFSFADTPAGAAPEPAPAEDEGGFDFFAGAK